MTDTLAAIKEFYQTQHKKKVALFVCGDFNSTSRSGVYEYMRSGKLDCMKVSKYEVSGQL